MTTLAVEEAFGLVFLLHRFTYRWPLTMPFKLDRKRRNFVAVNEGNVVRYPALIIFTAVGTVGKHRNLWYNFND